MASSTLQLPPFLFEVDGVPVQLVESSRHELVSGEVWHVVSVKVIYKGIHSRPFPLFVRNERELINKLKVEITKLKFIEHAHGIDEVKRLLGVAQR